MDKDINEILNSLETEKGIGYDEEGNVCKEVTAKVMNYKDEELAVLLLPFLAEDVTLSNRQLMEMSGIDRRIIAKFKKSQAYKDLLIKISNDMLLTLRSKSLQELAKILNDDKASSKAKIDTAKTILSHSERVTELMIQAGMKPKEVSIDDLLKEIENF